MTIKGEALRFTNQALGKIGLQLERTETWEDPRTFLPFKPTLAEARAAGMSVPDFVDIKYNRAGATLETIEHLEVLGVFDPPPLRVCEIGPGSGRYLEKIITRHSPDYYEIYETAEKWAHYLTDAYGVTRQPTDGRTLSATPAASIDLVQAHKVFVATPTIVTCRYVMEMARVARPKGHVVFDVATEACMEDPILQAWLDAEVSYGTYPALMPKEFTLRLALRCGLSFIDGFFVDMKPGKTECLVFSRN